jgi:alpha-glucosidase
VGRYVYLPEEMMLVRMRSLDDYETEVMAAGHHYVKAELSELAFFIRKDKAIPMGAAAINTAELDVKSLTMLGYAGVAYELYEDDGYTVEYDLNSYVRSVKW